MASEIPDRDEKGLFKPGHSMGRPKGSRNKLGEAFLADMLADWEENGIAAIVEVRETKPDAYLKVVASILPRDLNVNVNPLQEADDDELIQRLRDLNALIGPLLGPQGGDADSAGAGPQTAH